MVDRGRLEAEVAAIRLYSGPMFAPINYALRTKQIAAWATTIGCCYSGVLKLSFLSQPARVYRGVKEDERATDAEHQGAYQSVSDVGVMGQTSNLGIDVGSG